MRKGREGLVDHLVAASVLVVATALPGKGAICRAIVSNRSSAAVPNGPRGDLCLRVRVRPCW